MKTVGDGQQRVVEALRSLSTRRRGYCPSAAELATHTGLALGTVTYHLANLRQSGVVLRQTARRGHLLAEDLATTTD